MNWSGFLPGLASNLLADVIFAFIVAGSAILLGNILWRRRVRSFFDIPARRGRLPMFLSNIVVKRSGTTGTVPIVQGFYGTAISEIEYACALDFARTVETKPAYRALRALDPDNTFLLVDPIVCSIKISPSVATIGDPAEVDTASVIRRLIGNTSAVIVGGPIYNTLTHHLMEKLPSHFSFILTEVDGKPVRGIKVRNFRGGDRREYIRRPAEGGDGRRHLEYFIVERITWGHEFGASGVLKESKVFICAGTSLAATAAALRILADWPGLRRRFGKGDFGILYELYLDNIEGREACPPEVRPQEMYSWQST